MVRIGDYETAQELSTAGPTSVYLARRAGAGGAPTAAVKLLQLRPPAATSPAAAGVAPNRGGAPHDVFVSHSAQDKAAADAVCGALESAGVRCWIAPRNILPGSNWASAILKAIADSRLVVLIFSSHANTSPHIRREVERAVHHGITVAPIRVEDVMPVDDMEYFLGTSHWTDAVARPFDQHLPRLVGDVRAVLEATRRAPAAPAAAVPAPAAGVPRLAAAADFLDAARAQQQVARTSPYWAPVHDVGEVPHGAFYVTDHYRQSGERMAAARARLEPADLHRLVGEVVQGLLDLKAVLGRPHGNLKPSNVLFDGAGPAASGAVALCDPLPPSRVMPADYAADLDAVGWLIASLGLGHTPGGRHGWPAPKGPEWAALGRAGEGWRELYNLLRDPRPVAGFGLAEVQDRLAALAAPPPPRPRRWPVALAGVAGLAALAAVPLAYRASRPDRTAGGTPAATTQVSQPVDGGRTGIPPVTTPDVRAGAGGRAQAGPNGAGTTATPATLRAQPVADVADVADGPLAKLMAATNPGSRFKLGLDLTFHDSSDEGIEHIDFTITNDRECHILIVGQDSEGNVGLLLPDADHQREPLRLSPGQHLVPPKGLGHEFPVQPPYGRDRFKVIATTKRLDVLRGPAGDAGAAPGDVRGFAVDGVPVDVADLSEALGPHGWATAEMEVMTAPNRQSYKLPAAPVAPSPAVSDIPPPASSGRGG